MFLLPLHILAGLIALAAGALAMATAKGSTLHRGSGRCFVVAMLTMTTSAIIMAEFFRPNRVNVMAGVLTFYLVATAVLAVRRSVEQSFGLLAASMLLALATGAYAFALAAEAMGGGHHGIDGIPPQPLIMFGTIGLLGGLLDARLLWARSIAGVHRLARHLWRMELAMFVAAASLFLGQARHFPEPLRRSGLLTVPVVLVLLHLVYWLARLLIKRRNMIGSGAIGTGNS